MSESDIVTFALTLKAENRSAFLIVVSAVCWSIWKHRNSICLSEMTVKTTRNLVLLIRSLVLYWLGHVKEKIKDAVADA